MLSVCVVAPPPAHSEIIQLLLLSSEMKFKGSCEVFLVSMFRSAAKQLKAFQKQFVWRCQFIFKKSQACVANLMAGCIMEVEWSFGLEQIRVLYKSVL